jgi:hypothetical protein
MVLNSQLKTFFATMSILWSYSHHGNIVYGPSYLCQNDSENKMGVIGEWVSNLGGVTSRKTTKSIGF